ncbi:ECF RNA polymerase sigma-E factor [Baekduia alba]|uniref:RNA polymerase sigma factor n=1 Tax=Baekduia alba TaxID=2997333 RepID=UPI00233F96AD|nr:RNA polymerase sigma factor [Baekduia alba]WCB95136.1 ECF RNA polymerase sigma-E factor [Baekduia alba]
MSPSPSTDAEAIERSLREPGAFVTVFERHYAAVHGYASRRVGGDLADEIAAEAFLLAFDRRSTYDRAYADARGWLLAIASNQLRHHWRAERRRWDAWVRAQAGRPAADALPEALAQSTVDALAALASDDREALLLFVWGELTYDEVARAVGCPVGTVRSRIARARRRLQAELPRTEPVRTREEICDV